MATDREIEALTQQARELVVSINTLAGGTGAQMVELAKSDRSHRRMIVVLYIGFALDIILTVAMAIGGIAVNNLSHEVSTAQELTRSEVLCPLYQQFINSDTPAARELARKNGQDMEARAKAFEVIRGSYETLKCSTP